MYVYCSWNVLDLRFSIFQNLYSINIQTDDTHYIKQVMHMSSIRWVYNTFVPPHPLYLAHSHWGNHDCPRVTFLQISHEKHTQLALEGEVWVSFMCSNCDRSFTFEVVVLCAITCYYSGNTWLCVHWQWTHESGVTKCTTGEAWSAFSWHHSSVFHCQWTHNQVFLLLSHMLI